MRLVGGTRPGPGRATSVDGSGPTRGATRVLRVAVLGATSLALAAGAHVLGGGRLPTPGVLAVVAFLLGLSSVVLTVRRCRFPVLLAVLVGQQALLHVVFDTASRAGSACGAAMSGMGHGLAGHAFDTTALGSCSTAPATQSMTSMAMPGWAMWVAHLVAVAVTAALLARGEAWLWRIADAIVEASTARPGVGPLATPAAVSAGVLSSLRQLLLFAAANPRGPPAGRALCFVGPA